GRHGGCVRRRATALRARARRVAAEGLPHLASRRQRELRRSRRADRGHAPHPARGEALGFGRAVPARAQLLHAAAGPRGAAARDLYRLADASHARRHYGGGGGCLFPPPCPPCAALCLTPPVAPGGPPGAALSPPAPRAGA